MVKSLFYYQETITTVEVVAEVTLSNVHNSITITIIQTRMNLTHIKSHLTL